MYVKPTGALVVFVLLFWFSPFAHGQGLDVLKTNFTEEIAALNSRDINAAVAPVDDRIVLFGIFSPFPVVGKEEYQQTIQDYFDNFGQGVFTPIDPKFRIIGSTGVAWGNFRLIVKQKAGASESSDGRYMFTYARSGGKWVGMSKHYSLLKPLVR